MEFNSIQELHKHLIDNKKSIMMQRKSAIKEADSIPFVSVSFKGEEVVKSESVSEQLDNGTINVKVVINTTNLIDSHMDMHVKGIWKKSLSDNNKKKLLDNHSRRFEDVISSEAIASTKSMSWKSLGYPYEGNTEALIFDTTIYANRNEKMFVQYKNGWVDNHSVGMQYVNYELCVNSEEKWAAEEKAAWDKYYPMAVNKEVADEYGYFYAVTEAKVAEGSAVVFGSNYATPTLSVKSKDEEPPSTHIEPPSTNKSMFNKFTFEN